MGQPGGVSPCRDLGGEDLSIVADDDALYVGAVEYQLMAGGDPATRSDWVRAGTSITRVDPANNARLAYRRFPNVGIEHIALASADRLQVNVDGTETLFRRQDLATGDVNSAAVLDKDNVPVIVPYLYRELQGDYLVELHEEVEALTESLAISIEPVEPICGAGELPVLCFGEATTGPVTHRCDLGGTVTETRYASIRNVQGPGVGTALRDTCALVFDDCRSTATNITGLDGGDDHLSGSVDLVEQHDSYGQSSLDMSSVEFASQFLAQPDGLEIRTSGSRIESLNGRQYALREIDFAIESWQSTVAGATRNVTDLEFRSVRGNWSVEYNARVRFSGGLRIASDSTGGHSVEMQIDPPLSANYAGPDAPMLAGSLQIDGDDGSSVTVQAILNPSNSGDEQLHYLTNSATDATVKPVESLLIPFF